MFGGFNSTPSDFVNSQLGSLLHGQLGFLNKLPFILLIYNICLSSISIAVLNTLTLKKVLYLFIILFDLTKECPCVLW